MKLSMITLVLCSTLAIAAPAESISGMLSRGQGEMENSKRGSSREADLDTRGTAIFSSSVREADLDKQGSGREADLEKRGTAIFSSSVREADLD
ncbi:hypothetical protein N7454_003816 [Penicillium verhagenii]|nr:hypothetical protein N7454_003816 [Penicillium verhagenii]